MAETVNPAASPARRLDPLGVVALLAYLVVGGVFVFGFAWALRPAIEQQKTAPCKNMRPEPREGAAPDFTVQDLAGNEVSLADLRGKFVVLNFWATWCEPCITEWPQVSLLAERLADRDDVVVVAMSIDEKRADIEPFLQRMSLTDTKVKVLWDPEQAVHKRYGTTQIPDTYFVNAEGQLVHAFINVRPWGTPDALHCLDSVSG
jgi:peroxiredoxin